MHYHYILNEFMSDRPKNVNTVNVSSTFWLSCYHFVPVENVVGRVPLVSDHGAEGPEGGLPELGQGLHPTEVRVNHLQILGN